MWWHVACEALEKGRCLELQYDGYSRTVEVHVVGTTAKGDPIMRAWQVRSGKPGGASEFRLFRLDKTWRYAISEESSQAPRRGYNPEDPAIPVIRCRV